MRINLSEVISNDFKKVSLDTVIEADAYECQGDTYPYLKKTPVALTIANEGSSKVHITGHGQVTVDIPCGRCLASVPTEIDFDIDELVDFDRIHAGSVSDILDAPYIDENQLDTEVLFSNAILMRFPQKVLCSDDCKGLCPKCGVNLNNATCSCDRFVPDPRMAAIQDIFKQNKEV